MEKRFLFSMVMAAMMMGACTDEVPNGGENGGGITGGGDGYISLSLNLPTVPASRAVSFDDGVPSEYYVYDATLLLFTGNDEPSAKFHSAYTLNIGNWNMEGSSNDEITSNAKIVQEIYNIPNGKLWALVVLNHNGLLKVGNDNGLEIIGAMSPITTNTTLADINTMFAALPNNTSDEWNSTGFLMSNSPLYNGSDATSLLSAVDTDKIYTTENEADANLPAAEIFVERAQAKVTLKDGTNGTVTGNDAGSPAYKYDIVGWAFDNYNTKSYLVRNFDNSWAGYLNEQSGIRFYNTTPIKTGIHRTYWGKDVNYTSADYTGNYVLTNKAGETLGQLNAVDVSDYCFENTTDLAATTGTYTTRVIVAAKFNEGNDFFIVNNDHSNMYPTQEAITEKIKEYLLNEPNVYAAIKTNLTSGTFGGGDLTVSFPADLSAGTINTQTGFSVTVNVNSESKLTDVSAVNAALKTAYEKTSMFNVVCYKGGISYYDTYIRHFDETEAMWNTNNQQEEELHLGRWGVLRNNWYELTVTKIATIGDAKVPEIDPDPLDKQDKYISVDINILSWAKRTQSVEL